MISKKNQRMINRKEKKKGQGCFLENEKTKKDEKKKNTKGER
jgi:hypothetical protein